VLAAADEFAAMTESRPYRPALTTPAGGRLRDEEVHLWALDDSQQVTRLRHYVDTAKHIAAYAGEDTTA
jgi:hypothetical protein